MTNIGISSKTLQHLDSDHNSSDNKSDNKSRDECSLKLKVQELGKTRRKFTEMKPKKKIHVGKEFENDRCNGVKNVTEGNPGWADVMQKILQTKKPKRKKTIVLSKAKKLCDVKNEKDEEYLPFEIEKTKEKIKRIKNNVQKSHSDSKEGCIGKNLGIRVKPNIMDRERERTLQKIATKGVVQLFNAVKQQQNEITKKLSDAGPLERKREQVLKSMDKSTFLDVLMGGSKSISVDNNIKNEVQENKKLKEKDMKIWNVLREDFVMGTKLKDWDRKDEDEDEDSSVHEDTDTVD